MLQLIHLKNIIKSQYFIERICSYKILYEALESPEKVIKSNNILGIEGLGWKLKASVISISSIKLEKDSMEISLFQSDNDNGYGPSFYCDNNVNNIKNIPLMNDVIGFYKNIKRNSFDYINRYHDSIELQNNKHKTFKLIK